MKLLTTMNAVGFHRKLDAPLHDKFPLDFFAGVLWPGRIVDEYEWDFELEPYARPDRDQLIQDAVNTRKRAVENFEREVK